MHWLITSFGFAVLAAETIISPLPDNLSVLKEINSAPNISFGQLMEGRSTVLGIASPSATKSPPAYKSQPRKASFTIALLGDSMVDTIGPDAAGLSGRLTEIYPNTTYRILNYGAGGTNLVDGIKRLTENYEYLGSVYPPLLSVKPDIVVLESFAYNPLPETIGYLDKQWLLLAKAVSIIRDNLPDTRIAIMSTIAPNSSVFGDGAAGVNFLPDGKKRHTAIVNSYLENALKFADSQKLPVIDAYHDSLGQNGEGKIEYINPGDHIHYSDEGKKFVSQKIAEALIRDKLLE